MNTLYLLSSLNCYQLRATLVPSAPVPCQLHFVPLPSQSRGLESSHILSALYSLPQGLFSRVPGVNTIDVSGWDFRVSYLAL